MDCVFNVLELRLGAIGFFHLYVVLVYDSTKCFYWMFSEGFTL